MKTERDVLGSIRILNANGISRGSSLTDGCIYEVIRANKFGVFIFDDHGYASVISDVEMHHVERVYDDEEDTERNAELGEPSADCNCVTLSEIYDEIVDMKAMIGRLLRNGGESE